MRKLHGLQCGPIEITRLFLYASNMKLYLARHGIATSPDIDPLCRLSAKGEEQVRKVANFLRGSGIKINYVYHSPKDRAVQTAELYFQAIGTGIIKEISGLQPMDDVELIIEEIAHFNDDTLLVGHLPFMSNLLSGLVTGNQQISMVNFKPCSIVCLEKTAISHWVINWMLEPELI